jgi:hypothetical protein
MAAAEQSKFDRIELFEVQITGSGLKWPIGDKDNLRNAKVNAIMIHKVGEVSIAPSGRAVLADADFKKAYVTLSIGGEESIDSIPLTVFNTSDNDGRLFVFKTPKKISWEKSHFDFASAASVTNSSIVVTVFYEK